jgi:hypothetical protein
MDTVKRWAYDRGYLMKRGSNLKETHLLFNGGRLHIPREAEREFINLYAKWVDWKKDLFVIEQKTTHVFRMFVDLDYERKDDVSAAEVNTVSRAIHDVVVAVCKMESARCIVSTADSPKKMNDGSIKLGTHLVWPDIHVDSERALLLRQWIVLGLNDRFGRNEWEKMVDACVYTRSGLRLNGSIKEGPCSSCRGGKDSNDAPCKECHGRGKVYDRRKYVPSFCYLGDSEDLTLYENCVGSTFQQLLLTSIRLPIDELPDSIHVPECLGWDEEEKAQTHLSSAQGFRLPEDPTLMDVLHSDLNQAFPRCFQAGEHLTDVTRMDGSEGRPYFIVHTPSRYCHNLGRCHRSNRVYFYIDGQKMLQKCFCACDTEEGRKMGPCKLYSSAPHPISPGLHKMLFPDTFIDVSLLPKGMQEKARIVLDDAAALKELRSRDTLEALATEAALASIGWQR